MIRYSRINGFHKIRVTVENVTLTSEGDNLGLLLAEANCFCPNRASALYPLTLRASDMLRAFLTGLYYSK